MAEVRTHDALDNLVNQFADPMSFFRELIQNSLDAGTPVIEVDFEYELGKAGGTGVMIVHVNDFGEGMDREIIDTRLTRLFSSSKDGDLTKIGRFGIGFVSVFAIEPDAVCVDTSRGGENWRILFKRDRTFVRIARDEPVDGTKIRILKTLPEEEYERFVERAREVVTYWCRYARSEIVFQGEPVNEPFDVESPCKVSSEADGTRVVAGYVDDEDGFYGFYNKGLTLHEGSREFWPHVAVKVDSRYLEHTLTRDNVLRDENFTKAMEIARRLVERELPGELAARVEAYLRAEDEGEPQPAPAEGDGPGTLGFLYRMITFVASQGDDPFRRHAERCLFRSVTGRLLSLDDLRRAHRRGRLYRDTQPSALITGLEEADAAVVKVASSSTPLQALQALVGVVPPRANQTFCRPVPPRSEAEAAAWEPLQRALRDLLSAHNAQIEGVMLAHFNYPGSGIRRLAAITQREFGELTPLADVQQLGTSIFSRRRVLVVNGDHGTVERLTAVAAMEPEFAAYELLKLFFLRGELSTALDSELVTHALRLRQGRRAVEERLGGIS